MGHNLPKDTYARVKLILDMVNARNTEILIDGKRLIFSDFSVSVNLDGSSINVQIPLDYIDVELRERLPNTEEFSK